MKIEKNKIVFISVLAIVVIFIVAYTMMVLQDDENEGETLTQTKVPELSEEQKEYNSKLDAINDLKEVRENNAPSIYDENLIDSLGYYDPQLSEKEKQRMIDSVYELGKTRYEQFTAFNRQNENTPVKDTVTVQANTKAQENQELSISTKEIAMQHQLFFASSPGPNPIFPGGITDKEIQVVVHGTQVVKANYRLRMLLAENTMINGIEVPKNTPVFGFISFKPNRAMISIENVNHEPVKLKAYDLSDGSEGIYVENSFRADASREVLSDVVQDVNIAGLPQISGIKQVFQRSNRHVKVTVLNNYKLILKPEL